MLLDGNSMDFFTSISNTPSQNLPLPPAPPSSTIDTSLDGIYTPLNNATNNYLDPGYGASFSAGFPSFTGQNAGENMPPAQSATASSGSKRKADIDEDLSGPDPKKARALPITQEHSPAGVYISPWLQQAWATPQLDLQIANQQQQDGSSGARSVYISNVYPDFDFPPELVAIEVELNNLISFPVPDKFVKAFPSWTHPLMTCIARGDIQGIENRLYPYLWFPGRAPYNLQPQDYGNVLDGPLIGPMKKALKRLGLDYGTLAVTASRRFVLFFQGDEKAKVQAALAKHMGPNSSNGAIGIPGQNNFIEFMGQRIPHTQDSSGSNFGQPQATASHGHSPIEHSPTSTVAESPTAPQKRRATPRQSQNRNQFVLVNNDMAKRRLNGPPPGIPILMPVPDSLQAVSGPSTSYPTNTVFAEIHTMESFPHPQNTLPGPKRNHRRRATRAKDRSATPLEPGTEVRQKPKTQREKRRVKQAQDCEPSQIQAGPSGTTSAEPEAPPVHPISEQVFSNDPLAFQNPELGAVDLTHDLLSQSSNHIDAADLADFSEFLQQFADGPQLPVEGSYADVPVYSQAQFDGATAGNQDPFGQGQASLYGPDFSTFQSDPNQFDWSGFTNVNGASNTNHLTDEEFSRVLMEPDVTYDSVLQAFYSNPGFSANDGQTLNFT